MAGAPKKKKKSGAAAAAAAAANAPSARIKSAKEMRTAYTVIKSSPDGFAKPSGKDPQKMDLSPACIECTHCRLPVVVKDAPVATDKTFERLELKMGGEAKKELDAKRAEEKAQQDEEKAALAQADEDDILGELMAGLEGLDAEFKESLAPAEKAPAAAEEEEDDEGDEEDDESLDTVEQLERKVDDLEEKVDTLEGQVDDLEQDKADLEAEVVDLKKDLAAAEDRISFLEESEMRWRDKYTNAMKSMEDLLHQYEGLQMKTQDAECNIVKLRAVIAGLRVHVNVRAKRRNGLMVQLWRFLKYQDKISLLNMVINLWRPWARMTRRTRERDDQERQYIEDCYGRCWQVGDARTEEARLLGVIARNERDRWKGGQQLLSKVFNSEMPWILARPFKAWMFAHPTIKKENALDKLSNEHKELGTHCKDIEKDNKKLGSDLQKTQQHVASLKKLNEEGFKAVKDVEDKLKREMAAQAKEAKRKLEETVKETEDAAEERFNKASEAWTELQNELEDKCVGLQDTLDAIQFGGGGGRRGDKRVVPRGKGVLCLGCLRQLLHRDAKPLPPVEAYSCSAQHVLDQRNQFWEDEFQAAMKTRDEVMNHQWKQKIDPCGITPLSRPVTSEATDRDKQNKDKQEMRRPRSLASLNRPSSKDGHEEPGPPLRRVVWR